MVTTVAAGVYGLSRINPGNVGIRIFGGRIYNPKAISSGAAAGRTYEVLTTTATEFDAVRMVLALGNTDAGTAIAVTGLASAAAVANASDATISAAAWQNVTFNGTNNLGGSGSVTLSPAATSARRALTLSDIMPISSVARDDGGTYPLLVMRVYVSQTTGSTGNIVVLGDGSQSFANWATHPSGRTWRMLSKGGQFSQTNYSGMTSANSTVENGCPIVGMIYYARGKVVNVVGFGDSITEGQGTYIGEGFGFPACQALSQNAAGIAYEWSDMGWSGQTMTQIRQNVIDAIAAGLRWDIAVVPGGSPNDIASGTGYTGSIAATTLTVTASPAAPTLAVGDMVFGSNIAANTRITALGTGAGGNGTYTVSISQTSVSAGVSNQKPITTADISAARFKTNHMVDLLKTAGMTPIVWTWLPTNSSVKPYGSTDNLRRDLNDDYRGWADHGCIIADFDAALTGTTDASGQVQMLAGSTTDNIHPNDTGNAILSPIDANAIKKVVIAPVGSLVTA